MGYVWITVLILHATGEIGGPSVVIVTFALFTVWILARIAEASESNETPRRNPVTRDEKRARKIRDWNRSWGSPPEEEI